MKTLTSPGNRIKIQVKLQDNTVSFAALVEAIARKDGAIIDVRAVQSDSPGFLRDVFIDTRGDKHVQNFVSAVREVEGAELVSLSDCTFEMHAGGKLDIASKAPIDNYAQLSMAYTPGVARICMAIYDDPALARDFTIRRSMVAVITDGTAVLGLGNIGALAALPVMEGKAVLFKEFGDVNAFPVCVDTKDPEDLLETARAVAVTFGGINLEDIAAPVCFDIERKLTQMVDVPVFHDDQHGTAVVVGAAFINALKVAGLEAKDVKCVISGAGAAGVACTRALLDLGVGDIIICDRQGAIYAGRENLSSSKRWLASMTNKDHYKGSLKDAIKGANMFLGLSAPDILNRDDIRTMASNPIVFALANPDPEVRPETITDDVSVIATGRSDYPNQINNVLCFPGLFRGLMDSGAKRVTREMISAASHAIASCVSETELFNGKIIPSIFNSSVAKSVASAVISVAGDPTIPTTPVYFEFDS